MKIDLQTLNLFQEEQHKPFLWEGTGTAAVLIHGFPGTPAEMRPLAACLHQRGWTTHGLLLPGFGPQFDTLLQRGPDEWIEAAVTAVQELQQRHDHVLMIGYSMGGAVALNAAAHLNDLSGLVLIAPFWRVGSHWQRWVWQVLKRLFPRVMPFRKLNFQDTRVRGALSNFMPDLNLDDEAAQAMLREVEVTSKFVDELLSLGKMARQAASRVFQPTVLIQGRRDEVITPARSHELFAAIPGGVQYVELNADHEIIARTDTDFWPAVETAIFSLDRQFQLSKPQLRH